MPHFFIGVNDITENNLIKISDSENYRHIARSLRAKIGEKLLLIDDKQIQYETTIIKITKDLIICEINKSYPSKRDLEFDLFLAQSPLRSDAQLTVIEKATELGARGVYPIITDNCTVNIELAKKKQEKWQRVMYEASKQCERSKIPVCYDPTILSTVMQNDFNKILVMGERSTELSLKEYLNQNRIQKGERVLVIIGPEGGFSEKEFAFFRNNNLPIISLGDLILKAETATIVALGDIVYEYQG